MKRILLAAAALVPFIATGFLGQDVHQAQAQTSYLANLSGQWSGQGRAATNEGETPVVCSVDSELNGVRLNMTARCETQGRNGRIDMQLYYSDMSRQFHGELSSPLTYISGGLNGRLSRGDLFLRLAADDGSEGRLLFVTEGDQQVRLLVTTIVDGASITVLDLPLSRSN